jgi:hypothetical protein
LIGDSIQNLRAFDGTIDLFINDSDHSASYDYTEYQTVSAKLAPDAVLLGDNSHDSHMLARFAAETGRRFLLPGSTARSLVSRRRHRHCLSVVTRLNSLQAPIAEAEIFSSDTPMIRARVAGNEFSTLQLVWFRPRDRSRSPSHANACRPESASQGASAEPPMFSLRVGALKRCAVPVVTRAVDSCSSLSRPDSQVAPTKLRNAASS